jgi:DNA-binding FrmR family transcriptional regulator
MLATAAARPSDPRRRVRNRLRRVGGQVRAIERMIDEGRSCEEIVIQLLAARSALDELTRLVLSERVSECLATLSPADAQATITRAIGLLVRT